MEIAKVWLHLDQVLSQGRFSVTEEPVPWRGEYCHLPSVVNLISCAVVMGWAGIYTKSPGPIMERKVKGQKMKKNEFLGLEAPKEMDSLWRDKRQTPNQT